MPMLCVQAQQLKGKGGGGKGKGGSRFADMEKKAIAEPFVGVTTDGKVEKGSFEDQIDWRLDERGEGGRENIYRSANR